MVLTYGELMSFSKVFVKFLEWQNNLDDRRSLKDFIEEEFGVEEIYIPHHFHYRFKSEQEYMLFVLKWT